VENKLAGTWWEECAARRARVFFLSSFPPFFSKKGGNGERNEERDINNGIPFSMLRQDRRFPLLSKRSLDIST